MASEQFDLTPICKKYKIRTIKVTPKDDFYLIETNRGTKEMRVWPRVDYMRWSFSWREQMVKNGQRNVERFIRTKDSKPYVIYSNKGYSLIDHQKNSEQVPLIPSMIKECGRTTAWMHIAQQAQDVPIGSELLRREQERINEEIVQAKQKIREWQIGHQGDEVAELVELLEPVWERMERSASLLAAISLPEELLHVTHKEMLKENWILVGNQVFLRGFYRPQLSVQQRDTASYLRQLAGEEGNEQLIEAFLDGYEEQKQLSYEEYKLLLAFMAYPRELWQAISTCFLTDDGINDQELRANVQKMVEQQSCIDHTLQEIAKRAEQGRVLS
ncbi:hypothetical protein [Brevibacillus daliensis]|uniref:hypothetical protein n=1 Tax=Brevibacillus daliensis TaxID=2892995 RepID=UPI001E507920|nr:hypothetical protein [Brevibacillus daliensis]